MQKIIFQHTDNERAAHEALRAKLKKDCEEFERMGGVKQVIPFGESADPEARKVTGIESSDASRQVAARVNREHGGRMTAKQREVLEALKEMASVPGMQLTRQGLKNKMRVRYNILNSRLKFLQEKGILRVVGENIEIRGGA